MLLKEDKRKLDDPVLDELKKDFLKSLSDRDLADVAAYYSNLK